LIRTVDGSELVRVEVIEQPSWCEVVLPKEYRNATALMLVRVKNDPALTAGRDPGVEGTIRVRVVCRKGTYEVGTTVRYEP
jgi:hypothetical protein